jgi:hypothetical protein
MIPSIKTIETMLADALEKEHGDNAHNIAMQIRAAIEKAVDPGTVDAALDTCNALLKCYGVEAIRDNQWDGYYCDIGLLYVNMGDTYAATVVYDTRRDAFYITSWGDIVESETKRFDM